MLRYKGVLHMAGTDRKVIFQGVHQLMSSDRGAAWGQVNGGKPDGFRRLDLPRALMTRSLQQCLL